MVYVVIHDLWLLPLLVQLVGGYLHVLILILCHLVVENEGVELIAFCLLKVCLVLQKNWLFQC